MRKRKEINIEKYISPYEEGKISVQEIAIQENVCKSVIYDRLNEYYDITGKEKKERKERKKIKIEKYISLYEEGKMSVQEIARKENVCKRVIYDRLNKYYDITGKERPEFRTGTGKKPYEINIEPYIELLEKGKITKKKIAKLLGVSESLITVRIREYCTKNGKKLNLRQWNGRKREESQNISEKEKLLDSLVEDFLNKGLPISTIEESASKRNITIPEKFQGKTSNGLDREDD